MAHIVPIATCVEGDRISVTNRSGSVFYTIATDYPRYLQEEGVYLIRFLGDSTEYRFAPNYLVDLQFGVHE